jgi:hypothetical protein
MILEELGGMLKALEETRKLAETELENLYRSGLLTS